MSNFHNLGQRSDSKFGKYMAGQKCTADDENQIQPSMMGLQTHDETFGSRSDTELTVGLVNEEPIAATKSDFTVIWHNLTYKIDSRPWFTRLRSRCSSKRSRQNQHDHVSNTTSDIPPSNNRERTILNHLCGEAKSRQLTAILGPSGAGKSSLLARLFQNRTEGTTGHIIVDSARKSRLKVCFIPQHDYLNEYLTVREDLIFVSKLKSVRVFDIFDNDDDNEKNHKGSMRKNTYVTQKGANSKTSILDHEANALYVANLLGLNDCLDVTIKKISGGQKKRLSIARELMSKPDILVLDEPTTGLDSLTCYKTVMVLRDLARLSPTPMAVLCTIHQPERAVFNLFDRTYILTNTGRVIYEGSPKNVVSTLESVAGIKLPKPNYNSASLLIEIGSNEVYGQAVERLSTNQRVEFYKRNTFDKLKELARSKSGYSGIQSWKLCTYDNASSSESLHSPYSSHQEGIRMTDLDRGKTSSVGISGQELGYTEQNDQYYISYQLSDCSSSHTTTCAQSFRHVLILTHRSWLSIIRNPSLTRIRLIIYTVLPFMMLLIFNSRGGALNNCPKIEQEFNITEMRRSIRDGKVAQNVDDSRSSAENVCFFFLLIYGFGINIISTAASHYPLTMHMFKKETINGLYSPGTYFIGQMLSELPMELFFPAYSIILAYPLSGQLSSYLGWRMFAAAFVVFMTSYSIHSLGLLCGAIFVNDVSIAVLIGQALLLPFAMFSGFLIRPTRMPQWMKDFSYASPLKSGLSGVIAARYGFRVCECDDDLFPLNQNSLFPPNVVNVIKYLFPKNGSDDVDIVEAFDKLNSQFVKAQNFGLNLTTCEDIKPYVMHVFFVKDSDFFISLGCLLIIIVAFKLATFSVLKASPNRIN